MIVLKDCVMLVLNCVIQVCHSSVSWVMTRSQNGGTRGGLFPALKVKNPDI